MYTTEFFIIKANQVHNNKFTYDKAIYINSRSKIIITCPEHGDFQQVPACHLSGGGCLNCSKTKKHTIESFIAKANKIHNFKYDYSKTIYINSNLKLEIICLEHGSFWQKGYAHFKYGCVKCAGLNKITLSEFIEKANILHQNKFDYSLIDNIKNNRTIVKIICQSHGVFEQKVKAHLMYGCKLCSTNSIVHFKNDLIELFKSHELTYSLNKDKYLLSNVISVKCKKHGDFTQKLSACLNNTKCRQCYLLELAERLKLRSLTKEEFIKRATKAHNSFYDYSKIDWKNNTTKIIIVCPVHGDFIQSPQTHLSTGSRNRYSKKVGCPKCGTNISKIESEWLDSIGIPKELRNKSLKVDGKIFRPDAFDPKTNTIYEFYGDYWHGNPDVYNLEDMNSSNKKTFKFLLDKTIEKETYLKERGYKLITIWESEWKSQLIKNLSCGTLLDDEIAEENIDVEFTDIDDISGEIEFLDI